MGQLDHAPARSRVHALPAHYTTTRERESARAMLCMNLSGHTVIARLQMRSKVNAASGRKAGAQAKKAAFARSDSLKMMAALERKSSYDENQKRQQEENNHRVANATERKSQHMEKKRAFARSDSQKVEEAKRSGVWVHVANEDEAGHDRSSEGERICQLGASMSWGAKK